MSWVYDHWIILLFMALYLGILIHHAWVGQRGTRSLTDYYVGGRALGGIAVGLSFFATYSSTNSFVGFAGQAYTYGAGWLVLAPLAFLFAVGAWTLVAPRLRRFTAALDSLTIPDFFGLRFESGSARVLAAGIVIVSSFFYMTAVFKGVGNALEAFLGIPYWGAILVVFVIVVTYTAVGGFISVVKTDGVQGVMLIIGAFILFGGIVAGAGGLGSIRELEPLADGGDLLSFDAAMGFPLLLGIMIATTSKLMIEPRQLSRFYALKDDRAVRIGMGVSTITFLVVYALLVPLGLYARRIIPEGIADTDTVIPALLTDAALFHPALSAFILLTLLAAAMSSLDSVLLVMAGTCQRDLVGLWKKPRSEASAVTATRIYVALSALITTLIALNPPGGVVTLTSFSGSLYAACFFPAVIFGLFWRRGNGVAVIASILAGFLTLVAWRPLGLIPAIHEVFPAFALSTAAYVLVASWGEPCRTERVRRLFARDAEAVAPVAPVIAGARSD